MSISKSVRSETLSYSFSCNNSSLASPISSSSCSTTQSNSYQASVNTDQARRINQIYNSSFDFKPSLENDRGPEGFVDRILAETRQSIRDRFNSLVTEGEQSFNQNDLNDAEEKFADALKVISGKDDTQEALCSKRLGFVYLERAKHEGSIEDKKEDCMKAAGLLNYGLALALRENDLKLQEEIHGKLIDVEEFLSSLCKAKDSLSGRAPVDIGNKEELNKIRGKFENRLKSSFGGAEEMPQKLSSIQDVFCLLRKEINENRLKSSSDDAEEVKRLFQEVTFEMKAFVVRLIDQSKQILGEPPLNCKFAVMGLGSMAREEMTPFSDLEFAILIEEGKDTEEVRQYFRNLTYLIHLRVLNLGETIVPALGIKALDEFYDGITPRGFAFDGKGCLDKGHKTPLGKKGVFELIQTPMKMAGFQEKNGDQYWYEKEPFLPTELHNTTLIYGERSLVEGYTTALNTILDKKSKDGSTLRSHYAQKHLFNEDLIAFEANFGFSIEGALFELKKDLYRMPHLFIERLFLNEKGDFAQEESISGTFSKIDWLKEENKISEKGANNLKQMFGKILLSRLKNSFKTNSAKSFEDPLVNSPGGIDERVCMINYLFCQAVKQNLRAQESLKDRVFYSEDPYLQALVKVRLGKHKQAKEHITEHLKSCKTSIDGLILLAHIEKRLGNETSSGHNLDEATRLVNELRDDQLDTKVTFLSTIGTLYAEIGEHLKESRLFENAWHLVKNDVELMNLHPYILNNLGIAYLRRGKASDAQEILEKTLLTLKSKPTSMSYQHHQMALLSCLSNLAHAHLNLGNMCQSLQFAEESLAITRAIYGSHHPRLADTMDILGNLYFYAGSIEKGVQYIQEAFEITRERGGILSSGSVRIYLDLMYLSNKIDPKAGLISSVYLEYFEKIETLHCHFYHNIALAWQRINQPGRAESLLLNTVKMAKDQKLSESLVNAYSLLGQLYFDEGRTEEALDYTVLSLRESRKISENRHSEYVATNLVNLAHLKIIQILKGTVPNTRGKRKSIIELLNEAKKIGFEISKRACTRELFFNVQLIRGFFELKVINPFKKIADFLARS